MLESCVVGPNPKHIPIPGWLRVEVQGSGNEQRIVHTINPDSLPDSVSSVSAGLQVRAENAALPIVYVVTVEMGELRAPDDTAGASGAGLAWYRYDGDYTTFPATEPAEAAAVGYGGNFSLIDDSTGANAYIVLKGFLNIEASDIYAFGITSANPARVMLGDSIAASATGQTDQDSIGLRKGWHRITIEWCAGPRTPFPAITLGSSSTAAEPLSASYVHYPFAWENTLELTAPVGGEGYEIGDTLAVTWQADHLAYPQIVVSLSVDDGETWWQLSDGASTPCEEKQLSWVIPATVSGRSVVSGMCRVRLMSYLDNTVQDISPDVFGIGMTPISMTNPRAEARGGISYSVSSAGVAIRGLAPDSEYRVSLTTMQGRVLHESRGRGVALIPTGKLHAGIYVVNVVQDGTRHSFVLVQSR